MRNRAMRYGYSGSLLLGMALAGCSFVPDYVRPEVGFGNSWGTAPVAAASDATLRNDWWVMFGDAQLNALVERALAKNNDLAAAVARIAQARGSLNVAGASLLPTISAGASSSYARADVHKDGTTTHSADVSAAYEVDVFGKNRAGKMASAAQLEAAGYDRDALALTTASDVAQAYFNLMGTRERLVLANESLASSKAILGLLEARLRVGASGLLDVTQQRTAVAQAEANVASLVQSAATYQTALAILVGSPPQDFAVADAQVSRLVLPGVPVAAPAALLERRPDLKKAEANLKAADADIGAARAAFYPSLNLSAGLAQAIDPAQLGMNAAASLAAPIFSGGANSGNLQVAKGKQQEVVAAYRQAVLTSFGEVADALAALASARVRTESQMVAADNADTALRLAQLQLKAGTVDLPTLLNTQTSQLSARDAAVSAKVDGLNASVQLMRVMGGGFDLANAPTAP